MPVFLPGCVQTTGRFISKPITEVMDNTAALNREVTPDKLAIFKG